MKEEFSVKIQMENLLFKIKIKKKKAAQLRNIVI